MLTKLASYVHEEFVIIDLQVDVAIKKLKMFAPKIERRQLWITEMEILQVNLRFLQLLYEFQLPNSLMVTK